MPLLVRVAGDVDPGEEEEDNKAGSSKGGYLGVGAAAAAAR